MKPTLSVIMPAFNEALMLKRHVAQVEAFLKANHIDYEIILVNDGSTDSTLAEMSALKSARIKVISYSVNKGKGYAVRQGMKNASGDFTLLMDVDLSTDLVEIKSFLNELKDARADIVIGNRHTRSIFKQDRPWIRALAGYLFAKISGFILGCRHPDLTCGFKIFTREAAGVIFPQQRIDRWAFDSEVIFIAQKKKLRVKSLPVYWQHRGDSKVKFIQDAVVSLYDVIRIRINDMQRLYSS